MSDFDGIPLIEQPGTVIVDIDGTILKHNWPPSRDNRPELCEGVFYCFKKWKERGFDIYIMTARTKNFEDITRDQLNACRLPFDELLMGCRQGRRILINDYKPHEPDNPTAIAINLRRDAGFTADMATL